MVPREFPHLAEELSRWSEFVKRFGVCEVWFGLTHFQVPLQQEACTFYDSQVPVQNSSLFSAN